MLIIKDLNHHYGSIHALKGIDMEVREGEIVALIGANGAGKTTLLRCISGILKSSGGSIQFNNEEIRNMPAHKIVKKGLAQILEARHVFPKMTVRENIEIGAFIHGATRNMKSDMKRWLERFPRIEERLEQKAGTLSGGEQQMLVIVRAMMQRPKFLMLDEPSLGLAPSLVLETFRVIRDIAKEGTTMLLVEQNASIALAMAHRGYVMETGKIVLTDTGQNLINNENVKKAYLGME